MNSSSRNGAKPIWLCVHTTEGIMRATALRDWTSWPGSSHAANDETGVLLSGAPEGFVDYARAAWTLRDGNPISDNLEQCGWARWTRAEWLARPRLLDATARWLADRHKARPWIPLRRLTDAEIRARVPGVLGHGDYTRATGDGTHTDPGPNYPWDVVLAKAQSYAAGAPPITVQEDEDMRVIQNATRGIAVVGPGYYKGLSPSELTAATKLYGAAVALDEATWDAAVGVAIGGVSADSEELGGWGKRIERIDEDTHGGWTNGLRIKELMKTAPAAAQAPVSVDAAAVATALAGNQEFLAALAKAVNDAAATRLAS